MSDKQKLTDMSASELEELTKKIDIKIHEIDEKIKEVKHDIKVMENEIDLLYERRESADFADIQRIDDWINDIKRQIDSCKMEQDLLNREKDVQISTKENAEKILQDLQKNQNSALKNVTAGIAKKVVTTPVSATVRTVKSTIKSAFSKANPFDKKINKEDVSDSGIESIRLANSGIKTVKKSIRTTQSTIKTTSNVVKKTGTAIYKTAEITTKTTVAVAKFTGNVIVHIAATLTSPLIIFLIFLVVFLLLISSFVVLLMGVGTSGANSNAKAYSSASGLGDISSQYQSGLELLHTSLENHQNDFNSLIDSMYFNYDDLTNSSLVYMERTNPDGAKSIYEKSFATDDRKNSLKSEWNIPLTDREFLAIAYVWLENEKNTSNNSQHGIYEVTYTEEVFDTIIEKCVVYNDTVYNGQKCPDENCTRHVEYIDNPDYQTAVERTDRSHSAWLDWCDIAQAIYDSDGVTDDIQGWINNWINTYNMSPYYSNYGWDFVDDLYNQYSDNWDVMAATPEKIEKVTYICEYRHDLHSIGLAFFDKETVMNALDFDDISKQWVELTEKGFENNPDIS
ncbi:MAG: hypothetical protein NC177_13300 [Ruminococcus flavefaciens]|nr:hypothetical protein [Ruminococcus flavefaciens]